MIKNTTYSFGWLAIFNHWLMAIAVFFMFGLGLYMVDLTYYDANYRDAPALHKSLGLCLLGFYIFRLVWRLINLTPKALPGPRWEQLAAQFAHFLLYSLLLLLFVSGYLISTADGRGIEVFELFTVASLGAFIERQADIAGDLHRWLAWALMAVVAVHAMAALKHQFINRDNGLLRMIKPIHPIDPLGEKHEKSD